MLPALTNPQLGFLVTGLFVLVLMGIYIAAIFGKKAGIEAAKRSKAGEDTIPQFSTSPGLFGSKNQKGLGLADAHHHLSKAYHILSNLNQDDEHSSILSVLNKMIYLVLNHNKSQYRITYQEYKKKLLLIDDLKAIQTRMEYAKDLPEYKNLKPLLEYQNAVITFLIDELKHKLHYEGSKDKSIGLRKY